MKNAMASPFLLAAVIVGQLASVYANTYDSYLEEYFGRQPQQQQQQQHEYIRKRSTRDAEPRLVKEPKPSNPFFVREEDASENIDSYGDLEIVSYWDAARSRKLQGIPSAAEAAAFEWVNNYPRIETLEITRAEQLFGMVWFYFATMGDEWTNNTRWLNYSAPECTWYNQAGTPEQICDEFGYYTRFDLEDNGLVGTIPDAFYSLVNITSLDLEDNQLTGKLGVDIRNWRLMRKIQLNKNALTGKMPGEMASMRLLEELDFSENEFSRFIPPVWANTMNSLKILNLYFAGGLVGLTGTVPPRMYSLPNLVDMNLEYNAFTGTIPTEIGLSTTLEFLSRYLLACTALCLLMNVSNLSLHSLPLVYRPGRQQVQWSYSR